MIEINLAIEGVAGLLTLIWIGLTTLLLAAVLLPWRIAKPPPNVIPTGFEWTDPVSWIMQYVFYALLVLVPAAGIALQFARGHSLSTFWLAEIPSPWMADRAFAGNMKEVHEVLANLLAILALFHMTAALAHHWVFGDSPAAHVAVSSQASVKASPRRLPQRAPGHDQVALTNHSHVQLTR